MVLSMAAVVIMSKEDDGRNKAVEAAGTAVVGAGLLGGLLLGGGLLAKAIGDAAKRGNARSNGGNIVRDHVAHVPSGRAPPYPAEAEAEAAKLPSGPYLHDAPPPPVAILIQPEIPEYEYECQDCYHAPPGTLPEDPNCSEIKGRRVCCDYGECYGYTGPDPTPWQRAKFTSCEYSDGHLRCDFSDDCSEINSRMICCEEYGECSGYNGDNPRSHLCFFSDGFEACA